VKHIESWQQKREYLVAIDTEWGGPWWNSVSKKYTMISLHDGLPVVGEFPE